MNVRRQFLVDFAYLANYYGWTPEDIKAIHAETRAEPALASYWSILAQAHREGYEQNRENGYLRLVDWFSHQGRPNPFATVEAPKDASGKNIVNHEST